MTIDEAINISWGADKYRNVPRPSLDEALERMKFQTKACAFNWITGFQALTVLQEAVKKGSK